jgi:hypothetical protein
LSCLESEFSRLPPSSRIAGVFFVGFLCWMAPAFGWWEPETGVPSLVSWYGTPSTRTWTGVWSKPWT